MVRESKSVIKRTWDTVNKVKTKVKNIYELGKNVYSYSKMVNDYDKNVASKRKAGVTTSTKADIDHARNTDRQFNKIVKSVKKVIGK